MPRKTEPASETRVKEAPKEQTRLNILTLLEERGSLSATEAAEAVHISSKTAAKYLKGLVSEGLATPDGNARTRHYYWIDPHRADS